MSDRKSRRLLEAFGTVEQSEAPKVIQAGALTAELTGGNLSTIRFKGIEVLRGISYLVRDENWGTCAAVTTKPRIKKAKGRCDIRFEATARNGDSSLAYEALITLTARSLTFTVTATPDKDFRTNRTGFVVLHPIEGVAGKAVTVTHIDGTREKARFPKLISPGQPFFNIRALEHAPAPGLKAHVLMEGHKFEMEDQRNWGDASYKTYVCSLLDPWPYVLKAGERFTQTVTLSLSGTAKAKPRAPGLIRLVQPRATVKLPEIGLSLNEVDAVETLNHIDELKALAPKFLIALHEAGKTSTAAVTNFAAISAQSGIPLRTEVVLDPDRDAKSQMAEIAGSFRDVGLSPQAVIVTQAHDLKSFQPTDERPRGPSYEEMAQTARAHFPNVPIGGGMISYFTELNRKRPPIGVFDFLTHSICPIVHDASDAAVMQTLETLPHIFASARAMMGDSPYHLGPTTIAARMNPYGKDVASNPNNSRVCLAPNDPRQFGSFAAVWTLVLIASAAQAKLPSVCLGTLCGARGLITPAGKPSPLYGLLRQLLPFSGKRVSVSQQEGLISLSAGELHLLGNTTAEAKHVRIGKATFEVAAYSLKHHA